MKLATYLHEGSARVGIVTDDTTSVFDLQAAARAGRVPDASFTSMLALIDSGPFGMDLARRLFADHGERVDLKTSLGAARLLAPLPEPRQMRDFSVFPGHISGAFTAMQSLAARIEGRPPPPTTAPHAVPDIFRQYPVYYKGNRFSVVGHDHDVHCPSYSNYLDYELELGVVVGRTGANVAATDAGAHIFGYTIFNDFSARDAQLSESRARMGPAKGKDFDTGNVIGPWIVTPDELTDPYNLRMTAHVNGELWSEGSSASMLHSFEDMIAYVTQDETLHAGEFLGSGTVGGGSGLELGQFLNDGDIVELWIEGIGTLRNRIVRRA